MAKDPFDSLDPLEPLTLRQEFALAQTTEPGVVLMYEREKPGKEMLSAFVHEDRAWLYYWQVDEHEGYDDVGFRSYDPFYQGEADALVPYALDNGQVDEYPCSWTLPVDEALRAVEHFLDGGRMAPLSDIGFCNSSVRERGLLERARARPSNRHAASDGRRFVSRRGPPGAPGAGVQDRKLR